ncbi:phage tail length tape measure family protein [Rhodanobacter thiooxydans]|uniref:phage tail length tape measure family protein n=1 Tax=Rhodanobacter thiooxydans TaxID=416169 RepID=UPI000D3CDE79|nr:phage tail length tape measure family protein [Rhodanobacter thiooxydans]
MSNENEIVVQLTAETAQLQAGMEEGAATVAKATEEMQATIAEEAAAFNAAVQLKVDAMVRLNAAFAGGITSTAGIAEAEAALDQAMAAGALTAAEYAGYVGTLNTAEIDLAASTTAATVATEANTVAMTINGGVARELGVMIGELARGNYTRLEGSTITLANRTGVLSTVLQSLMSPIGLATVAAAALGYEVFEAGSDFRAMEGAVIATGQAAGYTAGQLDVMANSVGKSTGDVGAADEAFQKLAASGRFAGNDLRLVGTAAAEMAAMTGQSVGSIIAQIEKLQEDPLKAVAKLNDQFHFLTVAEFEQMQQLVAGGDTAAAASIAYAAMADNMGIKTEQVHQHVNVLIKAWRDLKNVWNDTMRSANVALGGGDTAEQLAEAQRILKNMQEQNAALLQIHSHSAGLTAEMNLQSARVTELTAKLREQSAAAGAVGASAQKSAEQIDAMAKASKKKGGAGHADHEQAQADRDAFNEQRLQHSMSLAEEKTYWQAKLAAAKEGTDAYRQAVNELLQIRSKQESASKSAARQEIADAKHVAEEQKRAIRDAETAEEEASKKATALSLERLKASHDEAIGELANKRQGYELQFSEGEINAAQLLQPEQQLAAQKLAIDQQYSRDKQKLDLGDQVAITKDGEAIVKAMQQYQAEMTASEKNFHKNSAKEWQSYAKQIEGAMQGAINGMLFQHQTLRQGIANISLVIGEDFIKEAVMKPLDAWISGESAKTAAALAGATQRQVIETGAAEVSKAADAATGRSQITSAAATAGAKAYQAIVGIPFVGPVLAPIAAGVAFAGVEAFGSKISSAQGGWERVPIDGAMTELHKDEMVLPAHVANPIRDMAKKGGGQRGADGGGNNYHFHSFDSRGIADYARRRPADFAAAMKHVARRGHLK